MEKKTHKQEIRKLRKENKELKEALTLALNKPLLRDLANEIKKVENGIYFTEEEFAKKHRLVAA